MLPPLLFIWLCAELAFYLFIGRGLLGADWSIAIAGALGALLGLRASLNAITWMFGMALASPAPRLGRLRTARLMLEEYAAYLLTFLLIIPFERLWMPPDRLQPAPRVILLVHGYGCSRGVWWRLRRRLEKVGCTVATLSLTPPVAGINTLLPQLATRIDAVRQATGCQRLTLVGHSLGGLLCRAYLAQNGRDKVDALVTLAAPHGGTELARLGVGQAARDMTPGSPCLQGLADQAIDLPAIAFRNLYDNYVMPQDLQRLRGAHDIALPPVGHIAMLYDTRVATLVVDACIAQENRS